jgi:hypothetical protein
MLHRRRIRRFGGLGKGSGPVTGEFYRLISSRDAKDGVSEAALVSPDGEYRMNSSNT